MKFIVVILFLASSYLVPTIDTDKIAWSESRKLTWSDFRAKSASGVDYVASTSSGISFSYSYKLVDDRINYKYEVESNFYPEESWYNPQYASSYILKHEQTHFDISELHARLLRKKISETNFSKNIKAEIEGIYQKVESLRRNMQNQFDSESEHSKNTEMEYRWEAFIEQQLKEYEHWK